MPAYHARAAVTVLSRPETESAPSETWSHGWSLSLINVCLPHFPVGIFNLAAKGVGHGLANRLWRAEYEQVSLGVRSKAGARVQAGLAVISRP